MITLYRFATTGYLIGTLEQAQEGVCPAFTTDVPAPPLGVGEYAIWQGHEAGWLVTSDAPPVAPPPPPPPPIRVISRAAFKERIPLAQRAAILAAAPSNPIVAALLDQLNSRDTVNLDDPATALGATYLTGGDPGHGITPLGSPLVSVDLSAILADGQEHELS